MAEKKKILNQDHFAVAASPTAEARSLVFKPFVDIFEDDREITLIADMPGVVPDDMTVELQDGVLRIGGRVRPWENAEESDILVEFEIGRYARRFTLPEAVDHDRIEAQYTDGSLRLTLPKLENARPRNIAVKTG
jgi:HSP20 family molecular chaperone IbpA